MLPLQSLHRTKIWLCYTFTQVHHNFWTCEVDSSHTPLSSEVKSSRMWSSRRWSTWGHFSLKLGHVSVPQRLAGLVTPRWTIRWIDRITIASTRWAIHAVARKNSINWTQLDNGSNIIRDKYSVAHETVEYTRFMQMFAQA